MVAVGKQKSWQLTCDTRGKAHQTFGILLESFEVDTWFGVESFGKGNGIKTAQVVVAGVVLGKKYQVEVLTIGDAFGVQVLAHVNFATDDRFDIFCLGSL